MGNFDEISSCCAIFRSYQSNLTETGPVLLLPGDQTVSGDHLPWEFFTARIRNRNTRHAYLAAVRWFAEWCKRRDLALDQVEPVVVAAYVEQHLAGLRMLFDWLVVGQVLPFNPANSVRGQRHVVRADKTQVLDAKETPAIFDGIDVTNLVGLRDRAFLGVLTYGFARVNAAVSLRGARKSPPPTRVPKALKVLPSIK